MVQRSGIICVFVLAVGACDSEGEGDDGGTGGTSTGGTSTGGTSTGGTSQCGGGNAAFTPAAEQAHDEYCATRAANVTACGTPDDDATCAEVSCIEQVYESEPYIDYVECQTQKSCEAFLASDDDCFETASGPVTPQMEEFVTYCQTRLEECATNLSDDICSVVSPLIKRSIFCGVDACLRGPCDAMPACLEQSPAAIPDCW